jgi:hypothetical protein
MNRDVSAWVAKRTAPCPASKSLLLELATWSNTMLRFAWPAVGELAATLQRSERHIKRLLRSLERAHLLAGYDVVDRQTGRTRARAYWFPVDGDLPAEADFRAYEEQVGGRVTRVSPWEGDTGVTLEGDGDVTQEGDTGVTPIVGVDTKGPEGPTQRAREGRQCEGPAADPDPLWAGFEAVERAYPQEGLAFSDRGEAFSAFRYLVDAGSSAEDLEAAAGGYGPLLAKLKRTQGPVSLQRFLREGRWRGCLGHRPQGSGAPGSPEPLAEVSAAIREAMGPKWPEVLLQDASWDEARRTVVCGSDRRADRLREAMRAKFEAMGVRVEGPPSSSLAAE